jgi:hypothetical protein
VRLLKEAVWICNGIGPKVYLTGEDREIIMSIRNQQYQVAYIYILMYFLM